MNRGKKALTLSWGCGKQRCIISASLIMLKRSVEGISCIAESGMDLLICFMHNVQAPLFPTGTALTAVTATLKRGGQEAP